MIPTLLVYNTCACVYIYILVYAYAVINRDDLVRGVNTRSLLTDFGCNRRTLTSQSRGAKQPLPEPPFLAPPITPADLQLLQMLTPKLDHKKPGQTPDATK